MASMILAASFSTTSAYSITRRMLTRIMLAEEYQSAHHNHGKTAKLPTGYVAFRLRDIR